MTITAPVTARPTFTLDGRPLCVCGLVEEEEPEEKPSVGIVLSGSTEKDGSGERMLVFVGEEESTSSVSSAESVVSRSMSIVRVPVAKAKGLEVLEAGRSELCQFIWIMGAMRVIVGSAGRGAELDFRS